MSSLQFLNKKSWHVGTKKNSEQVWLREQAAQKEAARIAELQKQLDEERKLDEVRRLELESGNVAPRAPRVDWMYEGPGAAMPGNNPLAAAAAAAAEAEEAALLGKTEAILPATGAAAPESAASKANTASPEVVSLRDAEAKLRDDPLLAIKRTQIARRSSVGASVAPPSRRPPAGPSASAPSKLSSDALYRSERKARKDERARIREERRLRRETQELPPPRRSHTRYGDGEHEEERKSKRTRKYGDALDSDALRRGEYESSPMKSSPPAPSTPPKPSTKQPLPGYGLRLPEGGTRVAVCRPFEPRSRGSPPRSLCRENSRSARQDLPRAPPQTEDERNARLESMQADAKLLDKNRAARIERHREEQKVESADLTQAARGAIDRDAPMFMQKFACSAIERASGDREVRLRHKRSPVTRDDECTL
jgi:N-terminal domain of CBF1 interacting co-repressor CIR/Pre-mRNA splicing factor